MDKLIYTTPTYTTISLRAFWRRFPVAVREKLHSILATGTQTQKDKLNAFISYVQAEKTVDLTDSEVVAAVTIIGGLGIAGFTPADAAALLASPPTAEEQR